MPCLRDVCPVIAPRPTPPPPTDPSAVYHAPVSLPMSISSRRAPGFLAMVGLSLLLHVLFVSSLMAVYSLLLFLGFDLQHLNPLALKEREIEFVLVDNPPQRPRDPNTRNRSDRMTRSGGEKVPNRPQAEPQQKAGPQQRAVKPTPPRPAQKPAPRPTPRPAPRAAQAPPTPPQPQARPAPPQPKMPPVPRVTAKAPVLPPNPLGSAIRTPAPPTPKLASVGPILTSPISGSPSGRSGPPTPTQIPGGTSGWSSPSAGNPGANAGGMGGRSAHNATGSPGGGGGRPGIDSLPEADFGPYMAELQRRIRRNWRPPQAQEDKRVVVLFKIARDGRLLSVSTQKSSGYEEADQAALGAIRLSAPFRPLPAAHPDNDVTVQFTFDYNVYRSAGGGGGARIR